MANMKKIFDERTKHRLVGIIVVFALMIIFLPVLMHESDKSFDELIPFKVPKHPPMPKVSLLKPKKLLHSVKAPKLSLPKPIAPKPLAIATAQPISQATSAANNQQTSQELINKLRMAEQKSVGFNEVLSIQLASFAREDHAQSLINKLRTQGFDASLHKLKTQQGIIYQVLVGQVKQRVQAIDLQKKLVDNTRLNGLIIKTKVS